MGGMARRDASPIGVSLIAPKIPRICLPCDTAPSLACTGSGQMGGYGSGRRGARPTVGSGLILDLSRLFKAGLKRGFSTSGTLRWSDAGVQEESASMGFEARLGENDGYIRLRWTFTD